MKPFPHYFTPDRLRVLVNYIRERADDMGLRDFQFEINPDGPEDDAMAETTTWGHSKTAEIWFSEKFFDIGPVMQREVVIHELVHWHVQPFQSFCLDAAQTTFGREAFAIFKESWTQHKEFLTDSISAPWARMMPLIDWGDTRPIYHGAMKTLYAPGKNPEVEKID